MNPRWRGCLIELVETVLLTAVIYLVVQHFVAQPYRVVGASMEGTLYQDQMVLIDKISPAFSDYKRGDVIVFQPPKGFGDEGNDPFIKRLIGLPGDLVEIHDGAVFVNGVKLDEPYVYEGQPTTPSTTQSSWRIPDGQFFVMGDHREASQDSRVFGPISRSEVIGRAWLRYWPLSGLSWVQPAQYSGVPKASPGPSSEPSASPSSTP